MKTDKYQKPGRYLPAPELTPLFFDCECDADYIHFTGTQCGRCGCEADTQPDSMRHEVQKKLVGFISTVYPPSFYK